MKKFALLFVLLIAIIGTSFTEEILTLSNGKQIIVYDDFTWNYLESDFNSDIDYSAIQDNQIPNYLRQGIQANRDEIIQAIQMYEQGWRYTMPLPKSAQAAWGNSDRRTTWYNGWWYNEITGHYSSTTPEISNSGLYLGDRQNESNTWRHGGCPHSPDVYMWLLSTSGGP
jgi:hypothetical protein